MEKAHELLFKQRLWKAGFACMPLNKEVEVKTDIVSQLPPIRVRASEFNKENTMRRISVSIDLDNKTAKILAKKR